MRHKKHHNRLSRPYGHRIAMIRNLASALVEHGRIKTTEAKAKALRPFIEKAVTHGRKGTQHDRRMVFGMLQDKRPVKKIFATIGPTFKDRDGGYTRIVLADRRMGDGAQMAYIEFTETVYDGFPAQGETEPEAVEAESTT